MPVETQGQRKNENRNMMLKLIIYVLHITYKNVIKFYQIY